MIKRVLIFWQDKDEIVQTLLGCSEEFAEIISAGIEYDFPTFSLTMNQHSGPYVKFALSAEVVENATWIKKYIRPRDIQNQR